MYWPQHQPQLGRGPTSAFDCGPRAFQVGMDDASEGVIVPGPGRTRAILGDYNETNYEQWDVVADRLGASKEIRGDKTNDLDTLVKHLQRGGGAMVAVHYGKLRRVVPSKTGSESFNGGHALFIKGWRLKGGKRVVRDYDSLNDGRYRGCPKGPVWMNWNKLVPSMKALSNVGNIFALLFIRPEDIDAGYEPIPPESWPDTLLSIIADLREVADDNESNDLDEIITGLEDVVGTTNMSDDDLGDAIGGLVVG